MSSGTTRRECDSRGLVTNIGAGAKDGIVGGISAGNEGDSEGKRGSLVAQWIEQSKGIIFLTNRCNNLTIENRYGTRPFLVSQINQPTHFTPPSSFAMPFADQATNVK